MGKGGCAVINCNPLRTASRHRFPNVLKKPLIFNKWMRATGNKHIANFCSPLEIHYRYGICGKHFKSEDYLKRKLKPNIFPSLHLPNVKLRYDYRNYMPAVRNIRKDRISYYNNILKSEVGEKTDTPLKSYNKLKEINVSNSFDAHDSCAKNNIENKCTFEGTAEELSILLPELLPEFINDEYVEYSNSYKEPGNFSDSGLKNLKSEESNVLLEDEENDVDLQIFTRSLYQEMKKIKNKQTLDELKSQLLSAVITCQL